MKQIIIVIALSLGFLYSSAGDSQDNCTTGTCHQALVQKVTESSWKHKPVELLKCKLCHVVTEENITGEHTAQTNSENK